MANYTVTASVTDTQTAQYPSYFPSPSFSVTASNMTGGADATISGSKGLVYSYLIPINGGYDPAGNLKTVTDSLTGTWSYNYDNLNRLTSGASSAGYFSGAQMSWTYDPFGNRLSQSAGGAAQVAMPSPSTASYTAASNQMTAYNGFALAYDAAGDVTQDALNSYLYDAEGRICAVKTAGPSYTGYIYDAAGTRVAKGSLTTFSCNFSSSTIAGVPPNGFKANTSWVLGPGGEQVTEYSVTGAPGSYVSTWQHTNAFSGGHITATYHDSGTYFYLADWLGSKRVELGANGCATAYASLPYGDGLTTVALPGFTACASDATEHHFTGKERDAESGNDYFKARYYSSAMGRFMSPDWSAKYEPIPYAKLDNPQTLNLYAYVGNNPMTRFDLDGHKPLDCSGANANGVGCQFRAAWNNTHGIIPDGTLKQLDQVAMKAEKTALGKTRADLKNGLHREWGGLILQNNETGAFSATSPITSNKEREVNVDKAAVPDGFSVVGDYHTHPHNTLTEGIGPSEGDISHLQGIARQTGVLRVGYVGETAGGYVSRYTAYEFNDHSSPPYGVVIGVVPPQ